MSLSPRADLGRAGANRRLLWPAGDLDLVRRSARVVPDPPAPARRSRDPGDDYLVALAQSCGAFLVSGDRDLLELAPRLTICGPGELRAAWRAAS